MHEYTWFCSSDSSLTESLDHCKIDFENDLKSLHCSDYFNFKSSSWIILILKSPKYGDFEFKITKILWFCPSLVINDKY